MNECSVAFVVEMNWARNTWEEICIFRDKEAARKNCRDLTQHTSRALGYPEFEPYRVREISVRADIVL